MTLKAFARRCILGAAHRSRSVQRVAGLIASQAASDADVPDTYSYLKRRFMANGRKHRIGENIRADIVERFEAIHRHVPMGTTATDGLFLAEMLLNTDATGMVVEAGCYAGGSSAKLSIIAKLMNRRLVVFDSFEGLPASGGYDLRDRHCRRNDDWVTDWTAGRYAATLDAVRGNVERYGEISVCQFVKGWFSDTLVQANLPAEVAFSFVDVDVPSSARDCFVALWPRLSDKGVYVTHDTAYIKVLQALYDPGLWRDTFRAVPPILFGAGYGLCNDSPHIGYMVKGESLSPDYLKSLTIDK